MVTYSDIRKLQLAVLDIYRWFSNVCMKNKLVYYLNGGCLLGAIRNGGFIPWDDDMDIVMPREDYEKFLKIALSEDSPFIINHYLSKTYTTGSYLLKICNPKVKCGRKYEDKIYIHDAFLSIFPLNGAPKSKFKRFLFKKKVERKYLKLRMVRIYHNGVQSNKHSAAEKIGIFLVKFFKIGRRMSVSQAAKKLDDCLKRYKYDESDYICEYSYGIAPFYWNKKLYQAPSNVVFEDVEIPSPTNPCEYLEIIYGPNYMTPPPENKRLPKHLDFIKIDKESSD